MKLLIFLSCVFFLNSTLLAADSPCAIDFEKFCSGKDGLERMKCMKKHETELSKECKNFRDSQLQNAKEIRAACKDDRKRFCAEKKRKEVMDCMQSNFDKLSETCRSDIRKFRK